MASKSLPSRGLEGVQQLAMLRLQLPLLLDVLGPAHADLAHEQRAVGPESVALVAQHARHAPRLTRGDGDLALRGRQQEVTQARVAAANDRGLGWHGVAGRRDTVEPHLRATTYRQLRAQLLPQRPLEAQHAGPARGRAGDGARAQLLGARPQQVEQRAVAPGAGAVARQRGERAERGAVA
eukprot:scaffold43558_cov69-Phaeocystis_antarctica.AAC.2